MKTAEEILFKIDQLRVKYKGQKIDIEEGSKYINEALELLTTWKEDICKKQRGELLELLGNYYQRANNLGYSNQELSRIGSCIDIIQNAPEPT